MQAQCLYGIQCYYHRLPEGKKQKLKVAMNKVSRYVRDLKVQTKLDVVYEQSRLPCIEDTVEKLYCSHRARQEASAYPLVRSFYEVCR